MRTCPTGAARPPPTAPASGGLTGKPPLFHLRSVSLTLSTAHAYGLVIVPPAGRNALTRMLKGSRVATVVRSVKASVLVARRPPQRVRTILAAISGGDPSAANWLFAKAWWWMK